MELAVGLMQMKLDYKSAPGCQTVTYPELTFQLAFFQRDEQKIIVQSLGAKRRELREVEVTDGRNETAEQNTDI